ncbi:MAG: gamma-glutamyltransferase family protein [Rhodobacteraceae bacterium]|nr:gamma-glutamyltransferase family protein [Paracoccaceae bacterium]
MRDFQTPGRSAVHALNGMCATSHPLAAAEAVAVLRDGGNAVDAAIAAALCLGICEPQMTGIGGDCFVLLKPPGEERILALNGSGRAPAALSSARLRSEGAKVIPTESATAVTVPGAIDAFCRLSQDWGKLGLERVLAPALRMAEEGVPVAARTALDWARAVPRLSGAARDFYLHDGHAPPEGAIFRAPGQAEVLRRIIREGRAGFYEGEVAEDMVASLNALGGVHSLDDLAATACSWHDPISGEYRGVELVEHPPNGQGATAILMANILACFDLAAMAPFGAQRLHLEAEAARLAYDARDRFLADPDHMARLGHMLDPQTGARLAALIDPSRAMEAPAARAEAVHRETVYLCVVDRDRMAVSMIYSVFHSFGSGLASSRFGINFQNRGAGFTLQEGHPNEAGGGKRPMHTIIPAMLREGGRVSHVFGVMGGAYQPCGHVRALSNLVDYGMDLQSALDAPRSFPEGGALMMERGHGPGVAEELAALGHRIVVPEVPIGGAQIIRIDGDSGVLSAASDPRKDGCAVGW